MFQKRHQYSRKANDKCQLLCSQSYKWEKHYCKPSTDCSRLHYSWSNTRNFCIPTLYYSVLPIEGSSRPSNPTHSGPPYQLEAARLWLLETIWEILDLINFSWRHQYPTPDSLPQLAIQSALGDGFFQVQDFICYASLEERVLYHCVFTVSKCLKQVIPAFWTSPCGQLKYGHWHL